METWHDSGMRFPRPPRRLPDSYRFPGFRPLQTVVGFFGDPHRRIIRLVRRSKKRRVASAGVCTEASTIGSCAGFAISRAVGCGSSWRSKCAALRVAGGAVKRERLDFLADNPRYTKRFAFYVGGRCRSAPIYDIAEELHLEWHTVKELEMQYMREQLRRAGPPKPEVIGIDEGSIRKAPHLSDRRQRPDSSAADLVRRRGSLRGQLG